jgi:CubicO group peptidase (beta-lactamase class C family)
MRRFCPFVVALTIAILGLATIDSFAGRTPGGSELAGLWRAKLYFGPEVKGVLTVDLKGDPPTAEIAGRTARVHTQNESVAFELPNGEGSFRGRITGESIVGHWIQPRTATSGNAFASPVTLAKLGPGRWRGTVEPLEDAMTFFLRVSPNADGSLGAFLRNPERNAGRFIGVEHIALDGRKVTLLGRRSKDAPEASVAEGVWNGENEILSIPTPWGTFDFRRATPADEALFYPRGKAPAPYAYRPPAAEEDGWPVASLEEAGLSKDRIERFVQLLIDTPIDSVHASEIHGVLIARHGRLVLEEYFHGFGRRELHDTRSAAKSLTSVLTGAAILRGDPVGVATPVYETMMGPAPAGLDPRKKAITVENLLTMSSGLDCDDSDPASGGNEEVMQEQTAQPDWYRYTLDQKMVRGPGEKAVYGSANPNLLGGVLARRTGRWLPDLFRDLIAGPLGIERYAMNLTPTGDAYMGGGLRLRLRDFLKVVQMILDGGLWHGRRSVSAEWARRSISALYELGGSHYGYLWWGVDYPYQDRTVRAFFAAGNGGQIVMGIPELDLVVGFYGGNYGDSVSSVPQRVYIPQHILPAVK